MIYSLSIFNSHFLSDFHEAADRKFKVFTGMSGGYLGSDPVLALGYDRIAETDDIYALLQHSVSEFIGDLGVIQHHGNDRMC